MHSRREVIAQLRANYNLDRRLAHFCHLHQLPTTVQYDFNSGVEERGKIEPIQLSVEDEDVEYVRNPQFSLPGPNRLRRLFRHSLYSSLEVMPIVEFLLDIVKQAASLNVDEQFVESLVEIADFDSSREGRFSHLDSDESTVFSQFVSKRLSVGISEKEVLGLLTLRHMELCLLILLIAQQLARFSREENPFEEQSDNCEELEDRIHDLIDEMAIEYAIIGRCPSVECINYFSAYHNSL